MRNQRSPLCFCSRVVARHASSDGVGMHDADEGAVRWRTTATEEAVPRRLGPKRATRIRKLFALDKADKMEKQYRLKREVAREGKKPTIKMPKIQRLVTPQRLQVRLTRLCMCRRGTAVAAAHAETCERSWMAVYSRV